MDLAAKRALLDTTLRELGSVMIAYSGGTDSAFLAWAAHQALGAKMLAVIADSASLPRAELAAAEEKWLELEVLRDEIEGAESTRQ